MITHDQLFALMEDNPVMKAAFCKAVGAILDLRRQVQDSSALFAGLKLKKKEIATRFLCEQFARGVVPESSSKQERLAVMELIVQAADMWPGPEDAGLASQLEARGYRVRTSVVGIAEGAEKPGRHTSAF